VSFFFAAQSVDERGCLLSSDTVVRASATSACYIPGVVTTALADRRNLGVTLAGGGNRAFYQLGLLHKWGERIMPRTAVMATVSAGACVACMYFSQRERMARDFWHRRRSGVKKNLDWKRLLIGKNPAPHHPIFRDTMLCTLSEGGLENIRALPFPILVLAAAFPRVMTPSMGVLVGLGAYNLEKKLKPEMVHPTFGRKLGFRPVLIDARSCETAEELTDLIIASASTPPFLPVGNFRGQKLLDGGLIDNVPAAAAEGTQGLVANLVLLTRPYPPKVLGFQGHRLYIAPTRDVPIHRWDYTRPEQLDETIEMGEAEADTHRPLLDALLAR
jgi:hypothetical protein